MVSADIVPSATSGEHLLEDTRVSKVETVVEDAFDLPDEIEESRNPSQDTFNRATLRELDDGTRKSEETSSPNKQQQRTRWWRFRRAPVAEPNAERQDLGTERTPQEEDSSSSQQEGSQTETAIVVRSESVNVLWGLMSRAARRNTLWRAASRVQESSKAAAGQRARQGAALRHGVRKWIRRRNADDQESAGSETEQQVTGTRQSWLRRFRRNRSQVDQSSVNVETSTAIVPYGTGPHPIATVMKKAAVGVTGTCMVIVGVPLLLFPGTKRLRFLFLSQILILTFVVLLYSAWTWSCNDCKRCLCCFYGI